ncbi:MAG: thymidylate synthase [Patescibacteria group bacterium]
MKRSDEYQYLDLAKEILRDGIKKVDRGTNVKLYSLFGRQTRYDLSEGFPLLTTKKVYWKGVVAELYWFFSGQTNIKYLVDNNVHIWDDYPYKIFLQKSTRSASFGSTQDKSSGQEMTKDQFIDKIKNDSSFAKKWGELPRIYGEMWRKWPTRSGKTIDQLAWAVKELREDPDAKNAIVTSWNPEYLYTMADKKDASRFPICHNMFQISRRGDKLSLQLYQRSSDLFLGVPFNIASYSLLTIVLAKILGLKPGEFVHTFGDVHIYENHIEQMKEQLKRKPRPFPKVKIVGKMNKLSDFTPDKIVLEGYDPYPSIKAELTIAGGLYEK